MTIAAFCGLPALALAQAADTPELPECAAAPTIQCIVDYALHITQTLSSDDRQADAEQRASAYVRIAQTQVESGKSAAARETLARALVEAETLTDAVVPHFKIGHPVAGPRLLALRVIATSHVGLLDSPAAQQALRQLWIVSDGIDVDVSTRIRNSTILAMAMMLANAEEWTDLRDIIKRLESEYESYTLVQIAIDQAQSGDIDGAMMTAGTLKSGPVDWIFGGRDAALTGIVRVQADVGDLTAASETADQINDEYFAALAERYIDYERTPDESLADERYAGTLRDRIRRERLDEMGHDVVRLTWDMEALIDDLIGEQLGYHGWGGDATSVYFNNREITLEMLDTGDLDGAEEAATRQCDYPYYQHCVEGLAQVALAYHSAGNMDDGLSVIDDASWFLERLSGYDLGQALVHIWRVQVKMGDDAGARETFADAVEAITAGYDLVYLGLSDRVALLVEMAVSAATTGLLDAAHEAFAAAVDMATKIGEVAERVRVLASVALEQRRLALDGTADATSAVAMSAAASVDTFRDRVWALADLASVLSSPLEK